MYEDLIGAIEAWGIPKAIICEGFRCPADVEFHDAPPNSWRTDLWVENYTDQAALCETLTRAFPEAVISIWTSDEVVTVPATWIWRVA